MASVYDEKAAVGVGVGVGVSAVVERGTEWGPTAVT